ncbi:hypothetical protein MtrunA17_Chr4g0001921 [Medicago truncatula]|uniref:GRP family n=1 Tax=Medicago truncatula TaxID=3880 RepID=A0A072UFN8_MEDTR|nr:putative glycine-rich cell wall structural protein 1 [Medicago truncatula]KEH28569.1 putative GRP family [Medicago truncatula]RHN58391.1 hypothetical protein MtrunA17_Chr4g0001921 [Medicago truncatula]
MTTVQMKPYQMNMKISMFLVLFLLINSCAQAISNKDEARSIQSNEQAQGFNGNLDGNGNIEASTRLNHKDGFVESQNAHKHELSVTIRKGGGGGGHGGSGGHGSGMGGRGIGRGRSGGAAAGIIGGAVAGGVAGGVVGGAVANHGHNYGHKHLHVCVPTFILCLSFLL